MKESVENLNFPPALTANLGLMSARRLTAQTALPLRLTLSIVVFLALTASAAVHYVDVNSTNPTPPYMNWATAATNIQDAVDAAMGDDEIVVTNGLYATGGRAVYGTMTNRVAVDRPLTLRSVNGPEFTVIQGGRLPDTNNGDGAIRCVYLANGASLMGFTLTNGATRAVATTGEGNGGGVWCESPNNSVVSNCLVTGNFAYYLGGGAYGGMLNNCTLNTNSAKGYLGSGAGACGGTLNNCTLNGNSAEWDGGGAYESTLNNCTLNGNTTAWEGGGAYGGMLSNCTLNGNWAAWEGAGAYGSTLNNCKLNSNSAAWDGGGAYASTLNNCTLNGNSAAWEGGGAAGCTLNNCTLGGNSAAISGGGVLSSTLNNCVVYFNTCADGANYDSSSALNYCCTTPLPTNGIGNITYVPLFVDTNGWANLRPQSTSPCINAGTNALAPTGPDLDGNPRIKGGIVDIGAYEYQTPVSRISYAWLYQYGLPINADTDTADPDGDGVDNYHEWLAGTDPTNRFSSPAQLMIVPSGVPPGVIVLSWSTNAVGFTLQSTTNLDSSAVWVTNSLPPVIICGQNIVINPVSGPRQFYRLVH